MEVVVISIQLLLLLFNEGRRSTTTPSPSTHPGHGILNRGEGEGGECPLVGVQHGTGQPGEELDSYEPDLRGARHSSAATSGLVHPSYGGGGRVR